MRIGRERAVAIDPVRSNVGNEVWYRRQLQALLEEMGEEIRKRILAAYNDTENLIGLTQDEPNDRARRISRAFTLIGRKWTERFDGIAAALAQRFSNRAVTHVDVALSASLSKAGFAIRFRPTPGSVEAYRTVIGQNVGLIKTIPEEYLKSVQGAVWESVMKGHDEYSLTQHLMDKYKLSLSRAAFIAGDQNNKARTIMENERFRELGIREAIWKHSFGGRYPRPSHLAFDGHRYDIDAGAVLDGKRCWPGSEPNCHCFAKPIIPAFEK